MDMFPILFEPEWPTSWLLKVIAEEILQESGPPEEAQFIFEHALDLLIPPGERSATS